MTDMEKVIRGLECCTSREGSCVQCPYSGKFGNGCNTLYTLFTDALALLKEQELEIKGLRKLVEWAVECDFGYDNLGDWWVDRFKSEIEGVSYTEGLIHLAKRYIEVFEEDSDDA